MSGNLVESCDWANTMALHLEQLQWQVRPAGLVDGPLLGDTLPVKENDFTKDEVKTAALKLKKHKATGQDEMPAEYWQTLVEDEDC